MYTQQEASKQRQAFWTTFGQYMQPILSSEGNKINWINYKTGVAGIHFKMDVDNTHASIGIVLTKNSNEMRAAHYAQLLQLKTMLQKALGEEWQWQPTSQIGIAISGVSIFRKEDWPKLISFFKPRIIALDAFWSEAKYGFEL